MKGQMRGWEQPAAVLKELLPPSDRLLVRWSTSFTNWYMFHMVIGYEIINIILISIINAKGVVEICSEVPHKREVSRCSIINVLAVLNLIAF